MPALFPAEPFRDVSAPICICQLPLLADEFAEQYGIAMAHEIDDLGAARRAFASIGTVTYMFESHPEGPEGARLVTAWVVSFERDAAEARSQLLSALNLEPTSLPWFPRLDTPGRWALWRLDDNGNEFEMMRFPDESRANIARAGFERRGHKQLYAVRPVT